MHQYLKKLVSIIILGIIASYVIKSFIFSYYKIPTASMEGTLFPGDGILVSKLHYGPKMGSQYRLPFTAGGFSRLPGFSKVKRGDVVVFTSPVDSALVLVKRSIALPGEILEIRQTSVFINSSEFVVPGVLFEYRLKSKDPMLTNKILDSLKISGDNRLYNKKKDYYLLTLTEDAATELGKQKSTGKIYKIVKKGGNAFNLFPANNVKKWSRDNYGPLMIPAKGLRIKLDSSSARIYSSAIIHEGARLEKRGNIILVNGHPQGFYEFKENYYFMMGDNRHHSADSRWIGFIPEEFIIGKAVYVPFSADAFGIRFSRMFQTIN